MTTEPSACSMARNPSVWLAVPMTNATTMIDRSRIATVAHSSARDETSGSPPSASRDASRAVSR